MCNTFFQFLIDLYGLNKIVTISYDQNISQLLPISRYSLKINVVGLGTAGAAAGIGLAALGQKVIAVDHDQRKVNASNRGRVPDEDLKLKTLLTQVRKLNNMVASCDLQHAILSTDLTMICLDGSGIQKIADDSDNMTPIVEQISATLRSNQDFHLIVVCQPTTHADTHNFIGTDIEQITGKTLGKDFGLCFIPLVLREQRALSDFYALPNMTVTASDTRSENLIGKLFNGFNHKIKYTRYIKM
ncbi:hypothetical protein CXF95_00385 [Paraglaciecola sp. MB-3u-78]|nr:hypothetical protein CXF95_00385 [Paraglaciecola sp. MB-3u-78]